MALFTRAPKAEPVLGQNRLAAHLLSFLTWIIGLMFFFPLFWLTVNGFKEESVASADPTLRFDPTLDRFSEVTEANSGLLSFAEAFGNSFWIVLISTVFVMVLAIPAAYALSIRPMKKWRDVLFFFISTKFLPIVGIIMPVWIIARDLDLLGTRTVLVVLYTAMNLPLAVWMLRSFFAEVPKELIEAAQIDGCSLLGQIRQTRTLFRSRARRALQPDEHAQRLAITILNGIRHRDSIALAQERCDQDAEHHQQRRPNQHQCSAARRPRASRRHRDQSGDGEYGQRVDA